MPSHRPRLGPALRALMTRRRPWPKFRIRLRTLLVVVALVALAMGAWRLAERGRYCLDRSTSYRTLASQNRRFARDSGAIAEAYRRDLALLGANPDHVPTVVLRRTPRDREEMAQLLEEGGANALRQRESYRVLSDQQRQASEQYLWAILRFWGPLPVDLPPLE